MTEIEALSAYTDFFEYYNNDDMASWYVQRYYVNPHPDKLVNPTYRFNHNTIITVIYPQTDLEKLKVVINYRGHEATLEFDDITGKDNVPQDYFNNIDAEITKTIRYLREKSNCWN